MMHGQKKHQITDYYCRPWN